MYKQWMFVKDIMSKNSRKMNEYEIFLTYVPNMTIIILCYYLLLTSIGGINF